MMRRPFAQISSFFLLNFFLSSQSIAFSALNRHMCPLLSLYLCPPSINMHPLCFRGTRGLVVLLLAPSRFTFLTTTRFTLLLPFF